MFPKRFRHVAVNVGEQSAPIVAAFSNGVPPESVLSRIPFEVGMPTQGGSGKSSTRVVVGGIDGVMYEGRTMTDRKDAPGHTRYLIGLLDKTTRECDVFDSLGLVVLHQTVQKQQLISPTAMPGAQGPSSVSSRAVFHEFGSRRKQRALAKRDTYQTTVERVRGHDAVQASIAETLAEEPTSAALESAYALNRNVPPHNLDALLPQDAYPLYKLVSNAELEECDPAAAFGSFSSADIAASSQFLYIRKQATKLATLLADPSHSVQHDALSKARYLAFLHYLLLYYVNPRALFPSRRREDALDPSHPQQTQPESEVLIPKNIASKLVHRFTVKSENPDGKNVRRIRSQAGDSLLLEWILCIAMHLSAFSLSEELYDIAHDLKINSAVILAHCKELGFHIERAKRPSPDSASTAEAVRYVTTLKCPLQFPSMPTKRGQKSAK